MSWSDQRVRMVAAMSTMRPARPAAIALSCMWSRGKSRRPTPLDDSPSHDVGKREREREAGIRKVQFERARMWDELAMKGSKRIESRVEYLLRHSSHQNLGCCLCRRTFFEATFFFLAGRAERQALCVRGVWAGPKIENSPVSVLSPVAAAAYQPGLACPTRPRHSAADLLHP